MRKGQIGIAILILIVIGAAVYFFWPYISGGLTFQPPQTPFKYKNDIITVEEYAVSNLEPYNDTTTTISFSIQNNGDKTVDYTEVYFYDLQLGENGFKLEKLVCGGKEQDVNLPIHKCVFDVNDKIESLDIRQISLTLKTPKVIEDRTFTIRYSIKYTYSGFRSANVPVIDDLTVKKPTFKFSESEPTYGPVVAEFEPPIGGTTIQGNQKINEYWGKSEQPFELKMQLKHVGTVKDVRPISVPNIAINFPSDFTMSTPCNFDNDKSIKNSILEINKPLNMLCYFKIEKVSQPQLNALFDLTYDYIYEFERSQDITVKPVKQ